MTDRTLAAVEPPQAFLPEPPDDPYAPAPVPHDRDAEVAVLGACLRDKGAIADVWDTLTPADFYDPKHELIFDAICTAYARLEPVDVITIGDRLTKTRARFGGPAYLSLLASSVHVTSNAGHYADIVAERAGKRRLLLAARATEAAVLSGGETSIEELREQALTRLADVVRVIPGAEGARHPWEQLDFGAVLDGDLTSPTASMLARRDGKMLLYPYCVHSISGEPGSLKTWIAEVGIVQQLQAGHNAAMLDFEDRAEAVAARLLQIGADRDVLADPVRWRYLRPDVALDATGTAKLDAAVADCSIVVIDGVTEAMGLHAMSINDNDDIARFMAMLPRRIADKGPAVVQIDHVTKDSDTRGRYAIGGQHKLAAITGTAMKAVVVKSGGKGEHGVVKLVLDKDKHGDVGPAGMTVAEFHLDDTADGQTFAWLDNPTASHDEEGNFRPTILMQRVSDYLLATPRAASLNEIKKGVKGNASSIAAAVECLVHEGHIRLEPGPRGAAMHHLVTEFEETA